MQVSKFKVISIVGISILLSSLLVAEGNKRKNSTTERQNISKPVVEATTLPMQDTNNQEQGSKDKTTQSVVESSNNPQVNKKIEPIDNAQAQISAISAEKPQVMNADTMANQSVVVKNPIDDKIKKINEFIEKEDIEGVKKEASDIPPEVAYSLGLKIFKKTSKSENVSEKKKSIASILMYRALQSKEYKMNAHTVINSLELYRY
jgi:hypothetical protein